MEDMKSVVPVIVNLFLHYAFDKWMDRHCPGIRFERYADDIICHCRSETQASRVHALIAQRLVECGLELHPEKSQVVYCKVDKYTLDSFESAIDALRCGAVFELSEFTRLENKDAAFVCAKFSSLPILLNEDWEQYLAGYELALTETRKEWGYSHSKA